MSPTSLDDIKALAEVAKHREAVVERIFTGTTLKIGMLEKAKGAKDVLSNLKDGLGDLNKLAGAVKGGAGLFPSPQKLLSELFGGLDLNTAKSAAGPVAQFAKEVTAFADSVPLLGSIKSGVDALWAFSKAATIAWTHNKSANAEGALRTGDPRTALHAMLQILERSKNEQIVKGSINATHCAVTAGMFFVDGGVASGPAAGAIKAVADLCQSLYLWGRDINEMIDGNRALGNPKGITAAVFDTAPILGCYLLTEANTSDIVNFMIADMGTSGWMDRIDSLLPELWYLQNQAANLVRDHRLQLSGLKTNKHKFRDMGYWERFKNWAKKSVKGGGTKVDKSRIVGMGSNG